MLTRFSKRLLAGSGATSRATVVGPAPWVGAAAAVPWRSVVRGFAKKRGRNDDDGYNNVKPNYYRDGDEDNNVEDLANPELFEQVAHLWKGQPYVRTYPLGPVTTNRVTIKEVPLGTTADQVQVLCEQLGIDVECVEIKHNRQTRSAMTTAKGAITPQPRTTTPRKAYLTLKDADAAKKCVEERRWEDTYLNGLKVRFILTQDRRDHAKLAAESRAQKAARAETRPLRQLGALKESVHLLLRQYREPGVSAESQAQLAAEIKEKQAAADELSRQLYPRDPIGAIEENEETMDTIPPPSMEDVLAASRDNTDRFLEGYFPDYYEDELKSLERRRHEERLQTLDYMWDEHLPGIKGWGQRDTPEGRRKVFSIPDDKLRLFGVTDEKLKLMPGANAREVQLHGQPFEDATPEDEEPQIFFPQNGDGGDEDESNPRLQEEGANSFEDDEPIGNWADTVVTVAPVQKVVKGGSIMRYRALVVTGNLNGAGGYGIGKAHSPQVAIERASRKARRNLTFVDRYQGLALAHNLEGKHNSVKAKIFAVPPGYGYAGSPLACQIMHQFGISAFTVKCFGHRNPYSMCIAIFNALNTHESIEDVARKRGRRIMELEKPMMASASRGRKNMFQWKGTIGQY